MSRPTQVVSSCYQKCRVRGYHPLCLNFPVNSTIINNIVLILLQPRQCRNIIGLGYFLFARHYLGNRLFLSFPAGNEMFQFPALALYRVICLQHIGLPHSDIGGSSPVCRSPPLFAAYYVLLRRQKPRHPPFALCNFS